MPSEKIHVPNVDKSDQADESMLTPADGIASLRTYREGPHGKDPETCDFREHQQESKCPSSRSPHQIRTGSISWQRDLGFPPEMVAERVNASLDIIEQHYDHQSALKKLRNRRLPYIDPNGPRRN